MQREMLLILQMMLGLALVACWVGAIILTSAWIIGRHDRRNGRDSTGGGGGGGGGEPPPEGPSERPPRPVSQGRRSRQQRATDEWRESQDQEWQMNWAQPRKMLSANDLDWWQSEPRLGPRQRTSQAIRLRQGDRSWHDADVRALMATKEYRDILAGRIWRSRP